MPPLYLLIKPVSGRCNMRCDYCFYCDEVKRRALPFSGVMSEGTLENVVRKSLEFATCECTFAFQGGEPTLAGLDFYKTLIKFVERHNRKKLAVFYAMQTNGFALDGQWAKFLAEKNFLVGVSIDGIKDTHDLYRKDASGKGTFSRALHAAQLLSSADAPFNILTVVTAQLAKNIGKAYGFYKRNNFRYQQYIPCLDPLGEPRGRLPCSLTPALYGDFLCNLFDLWYHDISRNEPVSIGYFDNLIMVLRGCPPQVCGLAGQCTFQTVVEADGSVYPCDFYALDEYHLGNLNEVEFAELAAARERIDFVKASQASAPECGKCQWSSICRGGCRRDRDFGKSLGLNYFCEAYGRFFEHSFDRLRKIAQSA